MDGAAPYEAEIWAIRCKDIHCLSVKLQNVNFRMNAEYSLQNMIRNQIFEKAMEEGNYYNILRGKEGQLVRIYLKTELPYIIEGNIRGRRKTGI